MVQLQDQLREVISVNIEFTNAVDSLQREVKCLEIRVEDLHLQMQNVNQEPERWDIHTPCSNQNEPDELHDWDEGHDAQVVTSESAPPLPVTSGTGRPDSSLPAQEGAVTQNLQEQNYGQLEFQSQGLPAHDAISELPPG